MSDSEAAEILKARMAELQKRPYSLFKSWSDTRHIEVLIVTSPSGVEYQIEIQVLPEGSDLRVLLAIDRGELPGSIKPLCDDFVVSES